MKEADKELVLSVKGKKVTIAKEDHYFTDNDVPVIKHAPLKKVAQQFGVRVERVQVEFPPIVAADGIFVAHRAFGRDEQGNEVSQVGEANPFNLEGLAVDYPVIMSNKRAEDRLLITLLGLEGEVYSENEIPPTTTSAGQANHPGVIPFGKHKGKTLEDVYNEAPDWVQWFVSKYQPKNARDRELVKAAQDLLQAKSA